VSRTIPVLLQTAFDQQATTSCGLLRIEPRASVDVAPFGFTSTNRAITYDDGDGEITYQTQSGYDASAFVSTSDTSVDNGEARILLLPGTPFSEAQVIAGELDGAKWTVYQIDYEHPEYGHRVVSHGYLGRPKVGKGGAYVALELRTLVDLLRQVPWEKWSRRCRVRKFGSQPGEERFPCMYDLTGEWVTGVAVTAVGVESDRTFTASSLGQADDYFAPGMVLIQSGDNEGAEIEVESFAGGVITLAFPLPYPIENGVTFDIRRDCTREWEGHNSCETYGNRAWYRGEPKIVAGDAMGVQVPGAALSPGSGGATTVPDSLEEA
jgi:uncharacterized phage protein (TIGR02218 family)